MNEKEIKKIMERLNGILEDKRGIKKRMAGEFCYGFLVALVDYNVISKEEYERIRGYLVDRYGYFV